MKNPFLNKRVKKEAVVEKYLKKQVEKFGGQIRKVEFPGHRGAPDRVILFPNKVLAWVELKRETEDLDVWQEREHERLCDMGQIVGVVRRKIEVDRLVEELYCESQRRAE